MVFNVNSPAQKIPLKVIELGGDDLKVAKSDQFFNYQMWLASRTTDASLGTLTERVEYLEGSTVVTAVDVTTIGNQTVICTDELTVNLTIEPNDRDVVKVKQANGNVIINGNGKTIDGDSTVTLRRNFTGLSMEFSSTADAWFIL